LRNGREERDGLIYPTACCDGEEKKKSCLPEKEKGAFMSFSLNRWEEDPTKRPTAQEITEGSRWKES